MGQLKAIITELQEMTNELAALNDKPMALDSFEPEIDEDACYEKFESEYWEYALDQGWHNEEYVLEQIANGHFYEWLEEHVGADELIYK